MTLCERNIMSFNKLIRISEQSPRADKSALAAINRALRSVAGLFFESSLCYNLYVKWCTYEMEDGIVAKNPAFSYAGFMELPASFFGSSS